MAHELTHVVQQRVKSNQNQVSPKLRRTIGDELDLTSPWFRGDPVLEAVFDNETLLSFGSFGRAVANVQQALIDAGFPLPRFGADGIFGSETRKAVMDLQREAGLNKDQVDGIVGPISMSHLDSLFGTTPAPDDTCTRGVRTITIDLVSLRGSSGDPLGDLGYANQVYAPCCVRLALGTGVSVAPELSDQFLGGDTDLEHAGCGEELSLFSGATARFGLSGRLRAFYVESMTPSLRGFAISDFCAHGPKAPLEGMIAVMNGAGRRTLAHEIGHVMLSVFGDHNVLPENIMHVSPDATGQDLVA